MIREIFAILGYFAILTLAGLGPAFWLTPKGPRHFRYGLGIAPTVGFAIFGLLGFPLVRYLGPINTWALPVTLLLVVASVLLLALYLRRNADELGLLKDVKTLVPTFGFVFVCLLLVLSPLASNDVQKIVFRTNPSDAFLYTSIAQTLRVVDWQTILHGITFADSNLAGLQSLAAASPTALFTARTIGFPLQLSNMVLLGWVSALSGTPLHRLFVPYNLMCFALAIPTALIIGDQLKLKRGLKYLGAAAVVVGFWARYTFERDASYQISAMPLMLLFVMAWIELESAPSPTLFTQARFLLALSAAAIALIYLPLASLLILAFLVFYGISILQRVKPFSSFLYHALTLVLVVLLITLTGQLDFLYYGILFGIANVERQKLFPPFLLDLVRDNGLAGYWGVPINLLVGSVRGIVRVPLQVMAQLVGLALSILIFFGLTKVYKKDAPIAERIVFSSLAGVVILLVLTLIQQNETAASKAINYGYPFFIFGALIAVQYLSPVQPMLGKLAYAVAVVWLLSQLVIGTVLPFTNRLNPIFRTQAQRENFDLTPITDYLNAHPPRLLLVNTPRTNSWVFPYYVSLTLANYPSYFQSGLVVDNNLDVQNFWAEPLGELPDYALVSRTADYVAIENWGTPIAETQDLILYQLKITDLQLLNTKITSAKEAESGKPVFTPSIPQLLPVR